jgi:hypothetical protein
MMLEALGVQRDFRHETEGSDEIGKHDLALQLTVGQFPSENVVQTRSYLIVVESYRLSISHDSSQRSAAFRARIG